MEREQIIKALECCMGKGCKDCPYRWGNCTCISTLADDALALINELTEDNAEKDKTIANLIETIKGIQADTVRKMQERLKECFKITEDGSVMYVENSVVFAIDQIAKEMLEEEAKQRQENREASRKRRVIASKVIYEIAKEILEENENGQREND